MSLPLAEIAATLTGGKTLAGEITETVLKGEPTSREAGYSVTGLDVVPESLTLDPYSFTVLRIK